MFKKLLAQLLESGIDIQNLLSSNIFIQTLNFETWPTTHTCDDETIRPYHKSLFQLGKNYFEIFHEDKFKPLKAGHSTFSNDGS